MNTESRFWSKVDKSEECWTWLAALSDTGYGAFKLQGRLHKAHRVAWELVRGTIPTGMQLDHMCHNRACVRPEHLRVVTNKQNAENRRGAQANSRSGVRGVLWHKGNGMWRVEACHNGKTYSGGYFHDLDDARAAAVALRNRLFTNNREDAA